MANYIQLFDKKSNEPESFAAIDEKLCKALNVPCDEKKFYHYWYDVIGYSGKDTIIDIINNIINDDRKFEDDNELIRILTWIDENYTLNAWCGR